MLLNRISWIPTVLFVIALPLFLITASVTWAFNNPGIYERGFEKYDISFVTGISAPDLLQVSSEIRSYFNSRQEPLDIRTRVFGREQALFKPIEIAHMRDVKRLVWGVYVIAALSAGFLLVGTAWVVYRRRGRSAEILARRFLLGGTASLVIVVFVGLFALVGFDTLFLKFHQLSFANDFWQLDSRTDFLVMLFPQDFWFDATMWVAIRAIGGIVVVCGVSGSYLLWLRLQELKKDGESMWSSLGLIRRVKGT